MTAQIAYGLCALTSLVCFALLIRSYRDKRVRLLLWSSLCFFFFALQNGILFVDLVIYPTQLDLSLYRTVTGFIGALVLLFALIWETS